MQPLSLSSNCIIPTLVSIVLSPLLADLLASLLLDHCDYLGLAWLIKNNLSILRSDVTSEKSILAFKVTYSQVLGVRTLVSLGSFTQPTTDTLKKIFLTVEKVSSQEW